MTTDGSMALDAIGLAIDEMAPNEEYRHLRVGTALVWIVALDDAWRPLAKYAKQRSTTMTELLHGARFARNAMVHGLAVTATHGGLTIPFTLPMTIPVAQWRTLDEVLGEWTNPWKNSHWEAQCNGFATQFAGRDVREPIVAIRDWLTNLSWD